MSDRPLFEKYKNERYIVINGVGTIGTSTYLLLQESRELGIPTPKILLAKWTADEAAKILVEKNLDLDIIAVPDEKIAPFCNILDQHIEVITWSEAFANASLIIDATDCGARNIEHYGDTPFVLQGSEASKVPDATPFIGTINAEDGLDKLRSTGKLVNLSCNSHMTAQLLKHFDDKLEFCVIQYLRRTGDIHQTSTNVGVKFEPFEPRYPTGCHQLDDPLELMKQYGYSFPPTMYGMALKLPNNLMHVTTMIAHLTDEGRRALGDSDEAIHRALIERFLADPLTTLCNSIHTNIVFGLQRLHGPIGGAHPHYAVVGEKSIHVCNNRVQLVGFTMQDRNVIVDNAYLGIAFMHENGLAFDAYLSKLKAAGLLPDRIL